MDEFVYSPSEEDIKGSNIFQFARINGIETINELYEKADADPEWFWDAVARYLGIVFSKPYDTVRDSSKGVEHTTWYNGGRLNITQTCILKHVKSEKPAIAYERENGEGGRISYSELEDKTSRLSHSLLDLGIKRGDRVAIYMPLSPEAVIAFYSILRIGAVVVPIFSGYGYDALHSRIIDSGARAIFVSARYERRGKEIRMLETARKIDGLIKIVSSVRSPHDLTDRDERNFDDLLRAPRFEGFANTGSEDPAIILYTSGTTGKPKGTVHVHGGSFINAVKEVRFYLDMKASDTLYWITDLGWMMGPWAILGANAIGGTIFLYDGAVDFPDNYRVWNMIRRNDISILGLSPTFVRTMKQRGINRRMEGVRIFGSTGEPWDDDSWMWLFEKFGGSMTPIANISGGTDIMGCFLASTPVIPLKPKCLYRGLGMNVSVFNEQGEEITNEIGYLVSRTHCPSMTRGIWRSPERYLSSYWSRFPGVWNHGDWAEMDERGYFFLFGRADDVIKVAGKRVGPNEFENSASRVKGVFECATVGIPHRIKGEVPVMFYTGDGSPEIANRIVKAVTDDLGKAFRPYVIHVPAIPKTRNGKIMRRVVKQAFLGRDVGDISNLEDETVIDHYRKLKEKYISGDGFLNS